MGTERRGGPRKYKKARTHQPRSVQRLHSSKYPAWPPPNPFRMVLPSLPLLPSSFPNRLAEHTLCFRDLSVVANTTVAEASQALVIQALVPFRTHSSPSRRATVDAAPASLPFPEQGSTKTIQAISGSRWCKASACLQPCCQLVAPPGTAWCHHCHYHPSHSGSKQERERSVAEMPPSPGLCSHRRDESFQHGLCGATRTLGAETSFK